MKKLINVLVILLLGCKLFAQCDLSLNDQVNELKRAYDSITILKTLQVYLDSPSASYKYSCFLQKGTNYRFFFLKTKKFDEAYKLSVFMKDSTSFTTTQMAHGVRFAHARDLTIDARFGLEPYLFWVDFKVPQTGVCNFVIKPEKFGKVCGLAVLCLNGKVKFEYTDPDPQGSTRGGIYTTVDEMPSFSKENGINGLYKWLSDNIKYPASLKKSGKNGRVYVQFVVNEDGKLSNFKVLRGLEPETDQYVIELMKSCPAWEVPGKMKGKTVKVYYTLPISFLQVQ